MVTLQELYESSGDAEAFGMALVSVNQVGIAGIALAQVLAVEKS